MVAIISYVHLYTHMYGFAQQIVVFKSRSPVVLRGLTGANALAANVKNFQLPYTQI